MNYVIGALQWKLPQAPLPFNPALATGGFGEFSPHKQSFKLPNLKYEPL